MTPILWQFKYSHYNEKIRWALDYKRVPHVRRSLLPGPHMVTALWKTGQKQLPLLEIGAEAIADSTRIIERLERIAPEPALYPADISDRRRALELEEYFDCELGPALRLVWFHDLLGEPNFVASQLTVGIGAIEQSVYRALFPAIRRVMQADLGINATNAEAARGKVLAALDRLEAELQPNGLLAGDAFSVADLTAAALWSPLVMPPEFPYPLITPLPEPAARWRDSLIARPGLRWVAETYRLYRGRSAEVAG